MRNENMFCSHCGGEQTFPMPLAITMFAAMNKAFTKMHKDCEKTWEPPEVNQSLSEKEKALWWLANGERGMSSDAIYARLGQTNIYATNHLSHPIDPADFRRCYLLLKTVPEWRKKLQKMKSVSDVWANLVDNWDRLTEMLEEQMKTNKPNGMYELMKKLGC